MGGGRKSRPGSPERPNPSGHISPGGLTGQPPDVILAERAFSAAGQSSFEEFTVCDVSCTSSGRRRWRSRRCWPPPRSRWHQQAPFRWRSRAWSAQTLLTTPRACGRRGQGDRRCRPDGHHGWHLHHGARGRNLGAAVAQQDRRLRQRHRCDLPDLCANGRRCGHLACGDSHGSAVYLGGFFTNVNGVRSKSVALLSLENGQAVAGFRAPAMDGGVHDLKLSGSRVLLGGNFRSVQDFARRVSVPRSSLAAITRRPGSWTARSTSPSPPPAPMARAS